MAHKIFIGHNFFGAGNFGDDLMLDGFLRRLALCGPQATVTACTPHDVDSQRSRFPAIQWLAESDERCRALESADVWLGLGGTPFQLECGPWSLDHLDRERQVCSKLGKPMVFLGVGCDSPDSVRDSRGRRVVEAAERIWTRDARSAEAIDGVAAADVVTEGADLAHIALGAAVTPAPEPALLGLLFGLQGPGIVHLPAVEQILACRLPAKTRWLIQEARSFPSTERWNLANLSPPAQSAVELMPMDYATDSIEGFLTNFGAPQTVLSSRYHGALVAAWHACRLSVIARTEKLDGIVDDFGVPALRRVSHVDELEFLVRNAAPVERTRLEALRDRASAMCDAFFSWL
jgi:polysaccharide pyruvyl transferase WcaK-like protein